MGMIQRQAVAATNPTGVNPPVPGPITGPPGPSQGWYKVPITSASTAAGAYANVSTPWGTLNLQNFTGSTITSSQTAVCVGSGAAGDVIVGAY